MDNKTYKITYWVILLAVILIAAMLEILPFMDGLMESGTATEFYCQYVMVAVTLLTIYAALKMIRKNPLLRMALLQGPALINLLCYHAFMNASFGYLAIIGIIAYAFVYPSKDKQTDENEQ